MGPGLVRAIESGRFDPVLETGHPNPFRLPVEGSRSNPLGARPRRSRPRRHPRRDSGLAHRQLKSSGCPNAKITDLTVPSTLATGINTPTANTIYHVHLSSPDSVT